MEGGGADTEMKEVEEMVRIRRAEEERGRGKGGSEMARSCYLGVPV